MSHGKHIKFSNVFLLVTFFAFQFFVSQGLDGDAKKGKDLFKQNCTACHQLDKKMTGPALKGVYTRLTTEQGKDIEWFKKWIKNSSDVIASGDPYAKKIFEENGKVQMTPFPNLSDEDIKNILTYVDDPTKAPDAAKVVAPAPAKKDNNTLLWLSFVLVAIPALILIYKLSQLLKLVQAPELTTSEEKRIKNFADFYEKQKPWAIATIAITALLALWSVWAWMMGLGVDKGYRPEQPIYFSHKIHAGINNIDCQLCHSGAKYGKVSEIPSLNVCMNCHKNIQEYNGTYFEEGKDKKFYDSQINELFRYVGFDKNKQVYTGKTEQIKWTRVHNMPDFVAFNHSMHVVAGEKAIIESHNTSNPNDQITVVCKACHGKIDTMNVVEMANDFTMQFCIDCHRKTNIDLTNGYNAHYFKELHEKMKKQHGDKAKLTVEKIGGIECGKCHY